MIKRAAAWVEAKAWRALVWALDLRVDDLAPGDAVGDMIRRIVAPQMDERTTQVSWRADLYEGETDDDQGKESGAREA